MGIGKNSRSGSGCSIWRKPRAQSSLTIPEDGSISYQDEYRARVESLLDALSPEEKIQLVSGTGYTEDEDGIQEHAVPGAAGFTCPIERLEIPSLVLADGPAGVRILPRRRGVEQTFFATAFPVATALASSWDLDLVEEVGRCMGHECREYGIDVLLAPGMNIHRDPRGGRNFEYYSEDPLLSGWLATAMVRGLQSQGVGASPKHYVANNQETNRYVVDTIVSERALREIYLRGFEIVVKESDPWTIMSAYNQVNGTPASQHTQLLSTVLRDEWGFAGVVMTDWFAGMDNATAQMRAGNELLMPGTAESTRQLQEALASGELSAQQLDRNVRWILNLVLRCQAANGNERSNQPKLSASARIARRAAADGTVLLKNNNGALPLSASLERAAVFGNQSYDFISGGTGSGDVNEAYTVSLGDALRERGIAMDTGLQAAYEQHLADYKAALPQKQHFWEFQAPAPEMIVSEALVQELAKTHDAAFITIGRKSGEFQDRELAADFYLTEAEKSLIASVSRIFQDAGKTVAVILNVGNVIEVASWRDAPDAIVLPWQGGQEAGSAVVDVLFGDSNPSARLATTFPVLYDDVPSAGNFPGVSTSEETLKILDMFEATPWRVDYEEGIYVGYRYYDTAAREVAYPFGFGLSYTKFSYESCRSSAEDFDQSLTVSVKITNVGERPGREVVQLYVSAPQTGVPKPAQELRGFAKTRLLAPGDSEEVSLKLNARDLASFDDRRRAWVAAAGVYELRIGASSRDIRAKVKVAVREEKVVEKVLADLAPTAPLTEIML